MWPLYYNSNETFDICNFDRYYYNTYDNFHILGILPVYGYMEYKVNEWMNEWMIFGLNKIQYSTIQYNIVVCISA